MDVREPNRQVSRLPALIVILRNHNLRLVKTGRVFRRGQPGQTFEVTLVFKTFYRTQLKSLILAQIERWRYG
jgi:hypothetical protein